MPGLNAGVRKYNLLGDSSFATTVSYGTEDQSIALGSEIDRKAMAGSLLEEKDLEILFYRARKAERQGRFQEALRDYQFIAKFYPDYQDRKIIQLAVANCLDSLEQNDKAILVLQQFENSYGSSEEIDLWIDELKSVTF
jgi:tetratricopeptide (TPR) repeat protein